MPKSAKCASQKRRKGSRRKCRRGGALSSYADTSKEGEEKMPNMPPPDMPPPPTEAPQEPQKEEEYPHDTNVSDNSSATNDISTDSSEPKSIFARVWRALQFWKGGKSHKRQKHRRHKTVRRK